MSQRHQKHPSLDLLTAFGHGKLSDAEHAEIEVHLAVCDDCCQRLKDLPDDTIVSLLRESQTDTSFLPLHGSQPPKQTVTILDDAERPRIPPEEAGPATAEATEVREAFNLPLELRNHARYRVVELLGKGGMGSVYKAEHRFMNRAVALKVIKPQLVQNADAVQRFRREVQAAARLTHPNIVTAHDAEQAGDSHFLVMEYVTGRDLAKVVDHQGALPVTEACHHVRQVAWGLQYAHETGMVHRDIKPQNLMLTLKGHVKILDFGLARFVSETASQSGLTKVGSFMGTPDYMAPEQARDAHAADIRADIYSLGCTLYCLLAGQVPFPTGSALEKVMAHSEREPQPLVNFRDDVPPVLDKVLKKMMAKDPAKRYQTPVEVDDALAPYVGGEVAESLLAVRAGSRRFWTSVVVLLFLIGLGGLSAAVYRISTAKGTLVIETDDPNVKVVIKQGGKRVTVIDLKTKQEVTLRNGRYEIELAKGADGLRLSTDQFTLTRGHQTIVAVRREARDEQKKPVIPLTATGPTSTLKIVVDASKGGGTWWFPQGPPNFDPKKPRQGKRLADFLSRNGWQVRELPREMHDMRDALTDDVDLVIRFGDFKPHSNAEAAAYRKYVEQGGSLILLMKPGLRPDGNPDRIGKALGLEYETHANQTTIVWPKAAQKREWLGDAPDARAEVRTMTIGSGKVVFLTSMPPLMHAEQPLMSNLFAFFAYDSEKPAPNLIDPKHDAQIRAPKLINPNNGAVLDNGTIDRTDGITWKFDWSDVPKATHYHLWVMGANASFPVINCTALVFSDYTHERRGSYIIDRHCKGWRWKVRAKSNGRLGPWSEERTFDVERLSAANRVAPRAIDKTEGP